MQADVGLLSFSLYLDMSSNRKGEDRAGVAEISIRNDGYGCKLRFTFDDSR